MGRFPAPPIYLRAVILSSASILAFYFGRRSWPSDACGRRPLGCWAHTALPTPWQGHWHHLSRSEFLRAAPGAWQTWISEIWKVKIGGAHPFNDAWGFGTSTNPPAKPSYNTYGSMTSTWRGGIIISLRPGWLRACCCCLWYLAAPCGAVNWRPGPRAILRQQTPTIPTGMQQQLGVVLSFWHVK